MFVQVIQGQVRDRQVLRHQLDDWRRELGPGAVGYLGTTAGVTADGQFIALVRFESAEAARRNNDRPEQDIWWDRTSWCFDGDITFHDSVAVDLSLGGGSDAAGFVQVILGHAQDRDRMRLLEAEAEPLLKELRPELIGSVRAWHADGSFTEAAYFTSEVAARAGEARMAELPAEPAAHLAEWNALVSGVRYLDLHEPWLYSP